MPGPSDPGFDTLALHAGAAPDPATGARALPIHLSTSFVFESSEHAASLFNLERSGHVYSRISNPTNAVFEERMAALEGGVGADRHRQRAGRAAPGHHHAGRRRRAHRLQLGAVRRLAQPAGLHAGALRHRRPRSSSRATSTAGAPRSGRKTKLLFGETLGNPGLDVLDIPTVAAIAHDAGVPLLVDSTFTTPYLMRPFDHGADLIFHSATKFLCGHGTVVGGVLVDGGRFDWSVAHAIPGTEPALRRLSRHGVRRRVERRRLPAARAPRRPARLRRLHEPAHRVADAAGHRDAAAAHGAACREHAQGGGVPGGAPDGGRRRLSRARRPPEPRAGRSACCPKAAARCSAST